MKLSLMLLKRGFEVVTNNYYAMLKATRLNKAVNCKNVNGQDSTLGNSYETSYAVSVANKQSSRDDNPVTSPSYSIFVVSGNTPTTLDTYKLDNEVALLASDVTISVSSISNAAKSGLFVLSRLFTNTGDSQVSISEAVLTMNSKNGNNVVLAREVFEPVILNPGESISIHIKVM